MVPSRCAGASYGVGNLRAGDASRRRQSSHSHHHRSIRHRAHSFHIVRSHASPSSSPRSPPRGRPARARASDHPTRGVDIAREIRRYGCAPSSATRPTSGRDRYREPWTTRNERKKFPPTDASSTVPRARRLATHHILRSAPARAWTARRPREAVARIALGATFAVVRCANIFCVRLERSSVVYRVVRADGPVRRCVGVCRARTSASDRSIDRSNAIHHHHPSPTAKVRSSDRPIVRSSIVESRGRERECVCVM